MEAEREGDMKREERMKGNKGRIFIWLGETWEYFIE